MFDHLDFRRCTRAEVPDLVRTVVWVDPAVTDTDDSDSQGIQASGVAADHTIYQLWSWEARTSPQDALERAILKAVELKAEAVGVETDQGGDTWQVVYHAAVRKLIESGAIPSHRLPPPFRAEKAGAGHGPKVHRAGQMLADYEKGQVVHVLGTHAALERALRRFPKAKPFDLADAAYWCWWDLRRWGTFSLADYPRFEKLSDGWDYDERRVPQGSIFEERESGW
jgi:phage terminase large subunit-like protein